MPTSSLPFWPSFGDAADEWRKIPGGHLVARHGDVGEAASGLGIVGRLKDAILKGTHPVSLDEAIHLAAIQCQVQFGDYVQERFKNNFLE
ncbi:uncharacterized protein DEA37_0008578 [Paragonimus westermani]|uniref:FERM central domain-containing protein n=1 Tax=Paragonimus westermani TaxID=34504 RepID=A0A5J4NSU8_9TREM|nr:uncharacterized protein DEA37_0008578 [Paragonimus westermani]